MPAPPSPAPCTPGHAAAACSLASSCSGSTAHQTQHITHQKQIIKNEIKKSSLTKACASSSFSSALHSRPRCCTTPFSSFMLRQHSASSTAIQASKMMKKSKSSPRPVPAPPSLVPYTRGHAAAACLSAPLCPSSTAHRGWGSQAQLPVREHREKNSCIDTITSERRINFLQIDATISGAVACEEARREGNQ